MSHPSVGQWKFACLIIAQHTVKTSSNPPVRIAMGITLDKMLKVLSFWYTRSTCIRTLATRFVLAMSFDVICAFPFAAGGLTSSAPAISISSSTVNPQSAKTWSPG